VNAIVKLLHGQFSRCNVKLLHVNVKLLHVNLLLLTLFPVKHTNALDRAVVRNQLAETSSTGRSNRLGAGLTALDRRDVESLDSLLREGPRRE
jgi:hypothetical protein